MNEGREKGTYVSNDGVDEVVTGEKKDKKEKAKAFEDSERALITSQSGNDNLLTSFQTTD